MTINNTRDFYIGKSLRNLPAFARVTEDRLSNQPSSPGYGEHHTRLYDRRTDLSTTQSSPHRAGATCIGSAIRRSHGAGHLECTAGFDRLPTGFCNRDLRNNLAALLGQPVEDFTQGRMSYQLRCLRLHGRIERIPKTHCYRLPSFGFRIAIFCTRTYARILCPGLGLVLPGTSSFPSALRRSFDKLERQINSWVDEAKLAA